MSTLLELADRCEREEPSRELDAAIARFLAGNFYEWWKNRPGPADFTTSLDAAVTLVPNNADWWEIYYERGWVRGPVRAEVKWHRVREETRAFAATPALALCAAALRARASMEAA